MGFEVDGPKFAFGPRPPNSDSVAYVTPSSPSAGCEWWLASAGVLALIAITWDTMEGTPEGHGPSLPFEIDELRGMRRARAGGCRFAIDCQLDDRRFDLPEQRISLHAGYR